MPRFLRRIVRFFVSFQVELRGHYSATRIAAFNEYRRTTSGFRALLISIVLPLPCLLLITLVDAIPMAPPHDGPTANYLFWVRECVLLLFFSRALMEQVCTNVPGLQMSSMRHAVCAIVPTLTSVAAKAGFSNIIGFPLPFQLILGMPVALPALGMCFAYFFGRILRQNRALLLELAKAITILHCQISLTFIYPLYFYGFTSVGETAQTYYVMLLPIIKLVAKNLISATLGVKYDLLPQIMIFNVDVFNALYVSSSMRSSNSITTTFVMISLDAVQAFVSILDISHLMKSIIVLQGRIPASHPLKPACFIDIALQLIKEDPQANSDLDPRRYSSALAILRNNAVSEGSLNSTADADNLGPKWSTRVSPMATSTTTLMVAAARKTPLFPTAVRAPEQSSLLMNIYTEGERKTFVRKTAQVLFTTEFVMLAEYTEVIVPLIYCIYTVASFYLPNRMYYPQLKELDEAGLVDKIGDVLTYALLELISLVIVGYTLQRKLGISVLRLISFVLDRSWGMVQSSLFLWIIFIVESSLEHSGNDYSFSFSWMKGVVFPDMHMTTS